MLDFLREAWTRGEDLELDATVDPEVVVDMTARVMNPEVYEGRDGLIRFLDELRELWEWDGWQVHQVLEGGDEILLVITNEMRGRASGVTFAEPVAQRYRFRGGRVAWMKLLLDVDAAVATFLADHRRSSV